MILRGLRDIRCYLTGDDDDDDDEDDDNNDDNYRVDNN